MEAPDPPTGERVADVRQLWSELDGSAPVTTAEVADRLGCTRDAAEAALQALVDRGELRTRQSGDSTRLWWTSRGTVPGGHSDVEEFSAFVSAVKDYAIFMLDPDGVVVSWNEGAERIKGYEAEEIVGEHFSTFYTEEAIAEGVPERNIENAIDAGRTEDEGWRVRSDGTEFWADVVITAIRDEDGELQGFTKVTRDMTERRDYERELQQRKDELETELGEILGRISDAFFALDDEFRFSHLNEQAAQHFGRRREELLGQVVWTVVDGWEETEFGETFRTAMDTQEPASFERYVEAFDTWFEFNVYPSESGLSVYFHDITERKAYQHQLEESNERLEQFAHAASHDLQEPLRMISTYLQLIERRYGDAIDEEGEEYLEFAVDGADRMRDMIQGLLEYSRVESEGEPLEPVDLDDVLAAVREDLHIEIEESGAAIDAEPLPRVRGDERQLRQLFQNLLDNAITYAGDEPPDVEIWATRTGDDWRVSVSDDGIGMDPAETGSVFEVFERLQSREESEGTGIGLALCQRILHRHGGDIWVDAEPGAGATFHLTLPAVDHQLPHR